VRPLVLLLLFLASCRQAFAQQPELPGQPITLENAPQRDTTNTKPVSDWDETAPRVYYRYAHSAQTFLPDSGIRAFHRRPNTLPWRRDLGNLGSPIRPVYFEPQNRRIGPSLGITAFDALRLDPDSLAYWNTTRPYTIFSFSLGSRREQLAQILHTQNLRPYWNVAVMYRKTVSEGFYKIQRTNHDNGAVTTTYTAPGLRYTLLAALAYNKEQHDENGGITSEAFLDSSIFSDRRTVPVRFQTNGFGGNIRSPVANTLRDVAVVIQHGYTLGRIDTLWSADSSSYDLQLRPAFRIAHRLDVGTQRHRYTDLRPDSLDYTGIFEQDFSSRDSVVAQQRWAWVDNAVVLSGYADRLLHGLQFSAGAGVRVDAFKTRVVQDPDERETVISPYLTGSLSNIRELATGVDTLPPPKWQYRADVKLFVAGTAAGNFLLSARVGRDLGDRIGTVEAGFSQSLSQAPYAYRYYRNQFYQRTTELAGESKTAVWGHITSPRLAGSAGVRLWLLGNYIYVNERQEFAQHAPVFNIAQGFVRKTFSFGKAVLENEVVVQNVTGAGPVNLPFLAGRQSLAYETDLFRNATRAAVGLELRYHTPYDADGWSPFFGRFFYQDGTRVSNVPEATVFFNFRVKRFRASLAGDQLQQLVWKRNVITSPGYPMPSAMFHFGFSWGLVN
jgi:hypothetical protein